MDKELIGRLAEQAGAMLRTVDEGGVKRSGLCFDVFDRDDFEGVFMRGRPMLYRFAALLAEECAKACEAKAAAWRKTEAADVFGGQAEAEKANMRMANARIRADECDDLADTIRDKFAESLK